MFSNRPHETGANAAKLRGVHLAIAVDNKDGDGNPGGRVKVKLPWMNDNEKTFWARIALPMAGAERGTYVLPEVDDQLLVIFEHGDIHKPIVIGAVWSKKHEIVEDNASGKNNTKLIKSRTGHRVIFDDKDGAGPNVCAVFKPPEAGTTGISFSTQEGKIELTCKDGKLSITAEKMVKFHITDTFELKAGQDLSFEGSSAVGITSASPTNFHSSKMEIH